MSTPIVVLISGSGTNLQALLDACESADYPAQVVAVGADRVDAAGLQRAQSHGIATFVVELTDFGDRAQWDGALASQIQSFEPEWVVTAGFMRLLGPAVLGAYPSKIINTHPALLPAFPGAHAVTDALDYGVRVTGCTVHLVDAGVDTGPVIAQQAVAIRNSDDEGSLHERIKTVERELLVDVVRKACTQTMSVSGRTVSFT